MKSFLSGIVFLFLANLADCQNAIPATGAEASGSQGSSSYTIGQVFYSTNNGTTGNSTQGIQQAFEFLSLSNTTQSNIRLKVITFPNPTIDFIVLKITDSVVLDNLAYTLFDFTGKSVAKEAITSDTTQIKMMHLSMGVYLLKITKRNKPIKNFKIIKKE
jgi:hypothetical protein|tara:strand:- start:75 stop:554 length:480 start_codon:yes stop_codon:yes gene_type:complete